MVNFDVIESEITCKLLEQAFMDYCENGDDEDIWQSLHRYWRKLKYYKLKYTDIVVLVRWK